MQPTKLTVRLLDKMKPGDRVTDTECKGLTAEAGTTGRIKLKFKGKLPDRSTFKQTLGEYPTLTLEAARKQALELRLKLKGKEDPRAGTARAKGMWTVATLMAEYADDLGKLGRAERTIGDMSYRSANYLSKAWGHLAVADITGAMARERHKAITKANGPVVANDTLRNFRAAINWARKTQHHLGLESNPVDSVTFNPQRERTESLELPDLKKWAEKVADVKNPIRREIHMLGLFSGLRPGTVVCLERAWLRLKDRAVVFPADVMKKRREFHLPLSAHMVTILERALLAGDVLFPGSPYVFPTKGNKTRTGSVIATQVWKQKGMANETGYILRHAYSNACHATGVRDSDRMLLLGQKIQGIKGTYLNDKYLFSHLLECQEKVSAHLLAQIAG